MLPRSLAEKPAPAYAREVLAELINPKTGCFKRELTVSLRTSDPHEGKRRDLREAARVGDLLIWPKCASGGGVSIGNHCVTRITASVGVNLETLNLCGCILVGSGDSGVSDLAHGPTRCVHFTLLDREYDCQLNVDVKNP